MAEWLSTLNHNNILSTGINLSQSASDRSDDVILQLICPLAISVAQSS